jgi:hypothetical protein
MKLLHTCGRRYIAKENTMAGSSKRIRIANRVDADAFLAKDFLELGGTQNATSYKDPRYINMTGPYDTGPGSVTRKDYSSTTSTPGSCEVLICTNPWSGNNLTVSGQIESYVQPGPAGGSLLDEYYSTFYNSQVGQFIVLNPSTGDQINCSQLTWWWGSMIILDRFGLVSNTNYTTQYGFYDSLTDNVAIDQDTTACQWRPGNLEVTNIVGYSTVGAIANSCTGTLPSSVGNLSLPAPSGPGIG